MPIYSRHQSYVLRTVLPTLKLCFLTRSATCRRTSASVPRWRLTWTASGGPRQEKKKRRRKQGSERTTMGPLVRAKKFRPVVASVHRRANQREEKPWIFLPAAGSIAAIPKRAKKSSVPGGTSHLSGAGCQVPGTLDTHSALLTNRHSTPHEASAELRHGPGP